MCHVFQPRDVPTRACCGFDRCHKYMLYLYLYLYFPRAWLRFAGNTAADRASAAALEAEFGNIAARETRVTRAVTVIMSCVGYTIALSSWPGYLMYIIGLAMSLATLLMLFLFPRRANTVMAILFLPASFGARKCVTTACLV